MEGSNNAPVDAAPSESAETQENKEANVSPDKDGKEQSAQGNNVQAEAKAKNLKKFKLKVDGQELDEEIDLNDDEAVKRHLQMSKAAQKRMSEAAQVKRQAEEFIHQLKSNPRAILTDPNLGVDFKKIAEEYLAEQLEMEMLSPEQRKLKEYESKIRAHEEEKRRQEQEVHQKQLVELQQRYADDYDKKFTSALQTNGIPKTPRTVKRMAELMHKNIEYGFELEPGQLAELVREDYINEMKELFGATDGDTLLKLMGDDMANKIRKADLARLKKGEIRPPKPVEQAPQPSPSSQRRMSTEEWLAEVRKRAQS
jgi:hypothetical protein